MTPRVWMNKLNGQIVIAFPWDIAKEINVLEEVKQNYMIGVQCVERIGWVLETETGWYVGFPDQGYGKSISEQFYDIGEW